MSAARKLSELWSRPARDAEPRRGVTAFVLSGGASMGALQVGMLRALIETRIKPDLVLGCSVGSMNGVAIAASPTLASVGMLQDVWLDAVDRDLMPTGLFPSSMSLVRKGESIQSSEALESMIAELLPVQTFEELEVPFQCVATNIDEGVAHWFTEGELLRPILASASIPAVFPAVDIDGVRHLDGAIIDDVPVRRAIELGATRIFVLQVGGIDRPRPVPKRPLDMAVLAFWIARRDRVMRALAAIPDDVEVVVVPHGDPEPVRYNDLSRSAQLMDVAYRAARDFLDRRADGTIPVRMGPLTAQDLDRLAPAATEIRDEPEIEADEAAKVASARELLADAVNEVPERAEVIGPAMRSLVERMRSTGDRALARVRELRETIVDDPEHDLSTSTTDGEDPGGASSPSVGLGPGAESARSETSSGGPQASSGSPGV